MQVAPGLVRPVDLAVDWWAGHIYWADAGSRRIVMTSQQNLVTIVSENLFDITAIAVNPTTG